MENADFIIKNGHLIEYIGKSEHIEVPEDITAIAEFAFEGNKTRRMDSAQMIPPL